MVRTLSRPVALALIALAALGPIAAAQDVPKPAAPGTIAGPVPWRVYPRDADGKASIPVALAGDLLARGAKLVAASIGQWTLADGAIAGVPAGGPYQLDVEYTLQGTRYAASIRPLFVGDLWILAGQSNMEGYGDLRDVTPPNERVAALGMDGTWTQAAEPLHWLVDSPDPVHSGDPATREGRAKAARASRQKGAGLGLPFAAVLAGTTGVPVGLVPCAHGGTSMAQWDPAKRGEGGKSLYGSMLRQLKLTGGPFRGMLWYQGESDAAGGPETAAAYETTFTGFIAAVREDLDQPDLPVYFVQIGRYVKDGDPSGWNVVRDTQRRLPAAVPNTAVVAAVDLDLDDPIHVGTASLKRLGVRLARIALREQFGQLGAETPTFDRVSQGPGNTLSVRFRGVNRQATSPFGGAPMPAEPPAGFPLPGLPGSYRLSDTTGLRGISQATAAGGLQPSRHIGGFSIRRADGTEIPLIYDAAVGPSRDAVVLRLAGPIPEGAQLWYGWGYDPYCNLTDSLDMAVPAFGPVPLDPVR